jgi:hypothetical protein
VRDRYRHRERERERIGKETVQNREGEKHTKSDSQRKVALATHHSTSNRPDTASSTGTEGSWTLHRYTELLGSWMEGGDGVGWGGWDERKIGKSGWELVGEVTESVDKLWWKIHIDKMNKKSHTVQFNDNITHICGKHRIESTCGKINI